MVTEKINKIVKSDIKDGLKAIYPEVFEDNKINFEKLKALLSGETIEKEDDRFYFNWSGKSSLYKLIQAPAYGTLKPDKERSVDFDNTENIVIVGENLETLKLLLKPYFGKVKMIYIDPPYNTGKDFIYRDNFKEPLKDYLEKTGQIDSEGKKLTTNSEASGRYHSDWLNFMYPRLFLARSLLRDVGVIFISIDDNEIHNLRKMIDEIFGEEQWIATLVWDRGHSQQQGIFKEYHEYILVYSKGKIEPFSGGEGEVLGGAMKKISKANPASDFTFSAGTRFEAENGFSINGDYGDVEKVYMLKGPMVCENGKLKYDVTLKAGWTQLNQMKKWFYGGKDNVYDTRGQKVLEFFFSSTGKLKYRKERTRITPSTVLKGYGSTGVASTKLAEFFNLKESPINNPKPNEVIKDLIKWTTNSDDIVLDFFAGSGTTGHAVWDLKKEDGGNRKFILVQLDEEVQDEKIKKEFPTVADICIERLVRVSDKYRKENNNQDFGFKVFKLAKSNFNLKDEFDFDPSENKEELKKKYLEWLGMFVDQPLISGWQEINVIYEVMLKEGLNLNSKIEQIKIKENDFYYVKDEEQNLEFYICLEYKIKNETVEDIRTTKYKGKIFVFIDKALTDNDKINLSAFVRLKVI